MLNFLKKVAFLTSITALVLGIAAITNFNATLIVEADGKNEDSSQNSNSSQASDSSENADSAEVTDLVKENLQTTIDQIEADELYQKFTQLFDLVEQVEAAESDEEIGVEVIKKIVATAAEIGVGYNNPLAGRGDYLSLSDAELDALIDSIKTIAHYQEYYELATLVQTAHQVSCSNEFSTDHIARLVESATDAALDVKIPVKNDYTANTNHTNSSSNTSGSANSASWIQVALSGQREEQKTSSDKSTSPSPITNQSSATSTINSIVERPSASHSDSTNDRIAQYNTSLADALAHTSTVCVVIGAIIVGGLNIRRQQKDDE